MEEKNKLLIQLHTSSLLGKLGTEALLKYVKNDNIIKLVKKENTKYNQFHHESHKILSHKKIKIEQPPEFYKMVDDIEELMSNMKEFDTEIMKDLILRSLEYALVDLKIHLNKFNEISEKK